MNTPITLSDVEKQLSEQGRFCLLDWLIHCDLLPYGLYENWRYGKVVDLVDALELGADTLRELSLATEQYCRTLKLQSEPQALFRWGDQHQSKLTVCSDTDTHLALSQTWLRQQDLPQLDLFMDNSAAIAENALRNALAGRQFNNAQKQLQQLTQLNPKHTRLGGYQDLINYGQHLVDTPQFATDSAESELRGLEQEVLPLAMEVLGNSSRDYLAYAWRRLGQNFESYEFDARQPHLHPSYAYMQIPDWRQASTCLQSTKQLYQQPILMERFCQCLENQQKHASALYVWCLLFESDQFFAIDAIESKQHPSIYALWEEFWEKSDALTQASEATWSVFFPCFLFFSNTGLVHTAKHFPSLQHPAYTSTIELINARQQGENEIVERKNLQSVNSDLLHLYTETLSQHSPKNTF